MEKQTHTTEEKPALQVVEAAIVEKSPNPVKEKKEEKPQYKPELDPKKSKEERILAFIEAKGDGEWVKLNDFLKCLYPMPNISQPAMWLSKGENKTLGGLLNRMVLDDKISIQGGNHLKLGRPFFAPNSPIAEFYSISNTPILAKK